MKGIKNIIFDLGGVVIDLERARAVQALGNLGIADSDILLGQYEQKGPFLLLESGKITASQFFDGLLPICHQGTSCTDIQDAFERFLVALPMERLETIRALRACGYRLFVLSNTNPVMYNHWIDLAFRQEGLSINDYFDGIVTSFQERTCKPDTRIFSNLLSRYGLNAAETLMLDDSEANCESARSLGINAIQIQRAGSDSFAEVCRSLKEAGAAK